MPSLSGSEKAPLYALANVARAGATRSGYISTVVDVEVTGVGGGSFITTLLRKSLEIEEVTGSEPNTATCMIRGGLGYTPSKYAEVVLTMGSSTNKIFAGHIVTATRIWNRRGERFPRYRLDLADYAWMLGHKAVWGRQWSTTPINEIVAELLTLFAPGFTSLIEPNLPAVTFACNTGEPLPEALTRLCRLAATVRWYVDYDKVIHVFEGDEDNATRARTLDDTSNIWRLEYDDDASQARTRTFVQGATTRTTANVAIGATSIAVSDVTLFRSTGGHALLGSNKIEYAGLTTGTAPAGTLTGIPASGDGAVLYAAAEGDAIAILEVSEDGLGQVAIASLLGGDGAIDHTLRDSSLMTAQGAVTAGQADLLEFPYSGDKRIRFLTRDPSFRANRRVTVNLGFDATILEDEPVGGWPLDDVDTGSTEARDISGNDYDLDVTDPLPAIDGPIGPVTAAALDGTGDPLLERAAFPMPEDEWTVEIWFKTAVDDPQCFTHYDLGAESFIFGMEGQTLHVCINGEWVILVVDEAFGVLDDDDWHQIVLTWDSASGELVAYLDGVEVGSATHATGETLAASGDFLIGQGI